MLGIPGEIVDATEHLLRMADVWRPRRVDLGTANGRCFTYSSGYGFDASVVKRIDRQPELKQHRLRELYFVYCAVETVAARVRAQPAADGRRDRRRASTTRSRRSSRTATRSPTSATSRSRWRRAAAWTPARSPGSRCAACGRATSPAIARRVLSSKRSIAGHPQVLAFRDVDGLRCVSADGRAIPLHVDGDHIGDVTEAVFGVRPGALGVVA